MMDFNELALNPAVTRLAAILREGYGLRSGLVGLDGAVTALGDSYASADKMLFDHFVFGTQEWQDGGLPTSLGKNARQWGAKIAESSAATRCLAVTMDVGFSGFLFPIMVKDQAVLGLFIAGFVPSEGAAAALDAIRRRVPAELTARLGDKDNMRIAQLDTEQRRFAQTLGFGIAEELALLAERVSSATETRFEGVVRFGDMLGTSARMRNLFSVIAKISRSNSSVLIEGENGTGKELVARAIHQNSRRRDAPFVAVNCAAIPGELIASELFGHTRGAFSGAHRERTGLFEAAHGGTLLLDEIGDMDPTLQVKLLRVLQEGTFLRVGDSQVRKVDVRVLCATNRDLKTMVAENTFREDLYYRVKVIAIPVPALRERATDIPLLSSFFVNRAAREQGRSKKTFSESCLDRMMQYRWPGNVRELENEIERLVIMSGDSELIDVDLLSPRITGKRDEAPMPVISGLNLPQAVEHLERRMILDSLQKTGWNKTQTAKDLGVSRRNLIRKVAHYGLEDEPII
ncbi:MAG: sigma-54-dependent Fis family transcriptional regulator [Bradymonadaceae bacterium]|nr:sigma-54-dependent Fis family transcriptional regulator [Lujinxingiaceae bacterium]